MSLDFSILDASGAPKKSVPLDVELHHELLVAAKSLGLGEVVRFHDYYEDEEIPLSSIPIFMQEIFILKNNTNSSRLLDFLEKMTSLGSSALSEKRSIVAISD
ncbi:hypothetical protein [Mesorhizobium sp. M0276]|uniref:hypothetical protein n=1 Tax=Mesorhizobium sp. M0276 TaxID=2956928 RepID=UPI0012EB0FBE